MTEMISSSGNPRMREIAALKKKKKERDLRGVFLVEGIKMFREIPEGEILETYVTREFAAANPEILEEKAGKDGFCLVKDEVFASVSDTQTPQGVLAVVRQRRWSLDDLLGTAGKTGRAGAGRPEQAGAAADKTARAGAGFYARKSSTADQSAQQKNDGQTGAASPQTRAARPQPLIMVLENLQDPGNLGTIVRTGEGAGVTGILLTEGSADIYNPKVTRSTMGSVFRVPFCYTADLAGDVEKLRARGVRFYAAHLRGTASYDQMDYSGPTGFLIGNESRGLSDSAAALADTYVRIPMCGKVESLNAAVASSILMYEAFRQRRQV